MEREKEVNHDEFKSESCFFFSLSPPTSSCSSFEDEEEDEGNEEEEGEGKNVDVVCDRFSSPEIIITKRGRGKESESWDSDGKVQSEVHSVN